MRSYDLALTLDTTFPPQPGRAANGPARQRASTRNR
jgi:hypothetical protein